MWNYSTVRVLGLGTSKNVSGVSNSSLQQPCDGSFSSILFAFSDIKGPAKGLKIIIYVGWEICEQNISTIFRVWELRSVTEPNVRIAWTIGWDDPCRRLFQVQPPLPPGFPWSLTPPSCENFQNPICRGGVDFFWNNPFTSHSLACISFPDLYHTALTSNLSLPLSKLSLKKRFPGKCNRNWG